MYPYVEKYTLTNRHPDPVNCHPILEAVYLMIKDEYGAATKLSIIPTSRQEARSVTSPRQARTPS